MEGHTSIDIIPHHWDEKRLTDVAVLVNGKGFKESEWSDQGLPIVRIQNLKNESASFNYYQGRINDQFLIDNGELLFSWSGSIGTSFGPHFWKGERAVLNQHIFKVLIKPEIEVDKSYLYYYLLKITTNIEDLTYGLAALVHVRKKDLENVRLYIPPLPEQRAIARVLRVVQAAREARLRELALERERKAALMEHLFMHGTRDEPTKMTEIGEMPESWDILKLSDLCSDGQGFIQTGPFGSQLHSSDYKECGIPVVNPTHLGINTINEGFLPFISKEDADGLSKHYLIRGDILISRRGDFSRYSYITDHQSGWLCGTGCILIRINHPNVDNYFLSVLMGQKLIQDYFDQNSVGSIMPNLNTKILLGLPIILPHVEEQKRMSSVLRACDSNIVALEHEALLHEELFRAMLEELMTGRLQAGALVEA